MNDTKKKNTEDEEQELVEEKEDKTDEKIKDIENKYKRALADYQNLEKRVMEEKREWIKLANSEFLGRLLPAFDTLLLAKEHVKDQGLDLSVKQLLAALEAEGVTQIKTKDEMFDPMTMECVTTEKGDEGKVVKELRAGYMLHGKIIRPAQVIVGRKE